MYDKYLFCYLVFHCGIWVSFLLIFFMLICFPLWDLFGLFVNFINLTNFIIIVESLLIIIIIINQLLTNNIASNLFPLYCNSIRVHSSWRSRANLPHSYPHLPLPFHPYPSPYLPSSLPLFVLFLLLPSCYPSSSSCLDSHTSSCKHW